MPISAIAKLATGTANTIVQGGQSRRNRRAQEHQFRQQMEEDRRRYEDDLKQRGFENALTREQHGQQMAHSREALDTERRRKAGRQAFGQGLVAAMTRR